MLGYRAFFIYRLARSCFFHMKVMTVPFFPTWWGCSAWNWMTILPITRKSVSDSMRSAECYQRCINKWYDWNGNQIMGKLSELLSKNIVYRVIHKCKLKLIYGKKDGKLRLLIQTYQRQSKKRKRKMHFSWRINAFREGRAPLSKTNASTAEAWLCCRWVQVLDWSTCFLTFQQWKRYIYFIKTIIHSNEDPELLSSSNPIYQ